MAVVRNTIDPCFLGGGGEGVTPGSLDFKGGCCKARMSKGFVMVSPPAVVVAGAV